MGKTSKLSNFNQMFSTARRRDSLKNWGLNFGLVLWQSSCFSGGLAAQPPSCPAVSLLKLIPMPRNAYDAGAYFRADLFT